VTAKHRVVIIPENRLEQGIDGYGGRDFKKRKVLRREWKTPRERSQGQQMVHDQSMMMEKSWVMIKDRTDKEHEE